MAEAPDTTPKANITLSYFQSLLSIGWKLCAEPGHTFVKSIGSGGQTKGSWRVCLASLPEKLGLQLGYAPVSPGTLFLPGVHSQTVIKENPPGHRTEWIEPSEEADKHFAELELKPRPPANNADPHLYLVTIQRAFLRLDVAKFSQYPANLQPVVLADIHETVEAAFSEDGPPPPESLLHTGDGFIAVFQLPKGEKPSWLLKAAIRIAGLLDRKNVIQDRIQVHFRMSLTLGPVYLTRDLVGGPNYVGEAITETERLISCMPSNVDDLVYFSDSVYRALLTDVQDKFIRLGSVQDKHGVYHRIYSLQYAYYGL